MRRLLSRPLPRPLDSVVGAAAYQLAKRHPEHEQLDLECGFMEVPGEASDESPEFREIRLGENPTTDRIARVASSSSIVGGGKVLKYVAGMGAVYDWRQSSWTPANGGRIDPIVFVQHIPVVPNMAGIADFVRLRDVLVVQGLMVANATDRDGNVALFTPMHSLCYHARGANQFSCGTEHMHLTEGEDWTKRQMRAGAWLINQALDKYGIPTYNGTLASGDGVARVTKRGQVSHKSVSAAAGFNDRSDPGSGYDWEYVRHCVLGYRDRVRDGTADTKGFEGL